MEKKCLFFKDDGFVSITMYMLLIYLYQVFQYYYNKLMYVIEIRKNVIEIYEQKLFEMIG